MTKHEINATLRLWDTTNEDTFVAAIERQGWRGLPTETWKAVFGRGDAVLKFDRDGNKTYQSATAAEYLTHAYAPPRVRKHLAKVLAYQNGLLIQERVPRVRRNPCMCARSKQLAQELGIRDYSNHGHRNGRILFFDADLDGFDPDHYQQEL